MINIEKSTIGWISSWQFKKKSLKEAEMVYEIAISNGLNQEIIETLSEIISREKSMTYPDGSIARRFYQQTSNNSTRIFV